MASAIVHDLTRLVPQPRKREIDGFVDAFIAAPGPKITNTMEFVKMVREWHKNMTAGRTLARFVEMIASPNSSR
ncbi:hypothetical protein L596_028492 [Steinernema carpocapsae]|uniref:Uncharacterized protein n=1 Tax=Steinernema carpocapsae TaxID=34508 RepID=A0A4U5LYK6_STECR|nr:hypothetical protein L596_028492 [Steinernema carpocapsae]